MDKEEVNIYLRVVLISILIIVIIVCFIYFYIKQFTTFNKEKIVAEVKGSEEERKKLSSDLHDDLGPILATIKIYVNSIQSEIPKDIIALEKINKNLDFCLDQVRELSNILMPSSLERHGLNIALEEFMGNIDAAVSFDIHYVFPQFNTELSKESELHIYRMIQEIVTNTIKYSQCKKLEITFTKNDKSIIINTIDDGIGFENEHYNNRKRGNGLANITNRVQILNGKINIISSPNNGVQYNITIPIQNI
jgi:signal transduction histidine kinase